jgi:hypothetical protein
MRSEMLVMARHRPTSWGRASRQMTAGSPRSAVHVVEDNTPRRRYRFMIKTWAGKATNCFKAARSHQTDTEPQ